MVPDPAVDPAFDLLVAFQAFFVGNLFAQHVAFGTIGQPLQIGVRPGKITRRQLGGQPAREQEDYRDDMQALYFQALMVAVMLLLIC